MHVFSLTSTIAEDRGKPDVIRGHLPKNKSERAHNRDIAGMSTMDIDGLMGTDWAFDHS